MKLRPEVLAIRHAPSALSGVCYGSSDVPVTLSPTEAADHVLRALSDSQQSERAMALWTSPLQRCLAVAESLAARWSVPAQVDPRLRELSLGEWEGRTWEDIGTHDGAAYHRWLADWQNVTPPGGETLAAFETRVGAWWQALPLDRTHVVLTHAGVIRALRVIVDGETWADSMGRDVPHLQALRFGGVTS